MQNFQHIEKKTGILLFSLGIVINQCTQFEVDISIFDP